ncbi:serine hydrolase [Robiginitalea sp. IMCC43444]|uniref:serine hydrolase n=1 Tax=Robiginitalea sp. IMCC43444 TaxID=3459121 RepID=UPI004041D517
MKNYRFLLIALFSLFYLTSNQAQDKVALLDDMIREGIQDWHIPGMTAIVVQEGEVVFSKVYGVRNIESQKGVNRETLFNMGSTTKAVVCMALGKLVDQKKLKWDDKVRSHLPEFRLSDPYITEEARVQDLLTHNLGIAPADLLWVIDSVSTEQTVARFALSEKSYPLRGGFAYNNMMYAVAGEVIEAVSGVHWTKFVEEHIFKPLEMERTVARVSDIFSSGNYVTPYQYDTAEGLDPAPFNRSDQIGAAGMIWTCTADMEHYLQMLSQGGVYKGNRLLSPETFSYLFKPHAFVGATNFYPTQELTKPDWMTYGLGWFQHDYRGHKLDFHTGSIAGLVAIAGVIHDTKTAVYVLANRDHAELRHAILYKAMDLWAFNDSERHWHREIFDLYEKRKGLAEAALEKFNKSQIPGTSTSQSLQAFRGRYTHPMLGEAMVNVAESGLEITFNGFVNFNAEHWHYNSFISDKENKLQSRLLFTFEIGPEGTVSKLGAFGEYFKKVSE